MILKRSIDRTTGKRLIVFLFTLSLLFCTADARAGRETMSARLNSGQITAGAILAALDNKYPDLNLSGTAVIKSSMGKVTLALDQYASSLNYFGIPNVYLKVEVQIDHMDASGTWFSQVRDLVVDYNSTGLSTEKSNVVIRDAHIVVVKIIQFKDISNNPVASPFLPSNLFLETSVETERYYELNQSTPPVANHYYHSASDELEIYWNLIDGAEEYELEYTYVNGVDASSVAYDYSTPSPATYATQAATSLEFSFNNNATRIRTSKNSFHVNMNYDRGLLVYRVRAIGRSLPDPDLELSGTWSLAQAQTVLTMVLPGGGFDDYYQITTGHEENKNWQITTSFAEEGKKKEVISYFDGSLRKRQTVTRNNSEQIALITETFYDSQGRPAITVLPSPDNTYSPLLKYYENFNQSTIKPAGQPEPYNRVDFETPGTCPASADPMENSQEGAAFYYSSNNTNQEGHNAYLPDAEQYPFTHSMYTPDNTGRVRYQGGVGTDHKTGSNHETKYLYGDADQEMLDALFGSEAGHWEKYKKNTVVDPNGQMSVSYLNTEGKTVATALSGNPPQNLGPLSSYNVTGRHSTYMDYQEANYTTVNKTGNGALVFKKKIVPDYDGNYDFSYSVSGAQFTDPCIPGFCYDCVYQVDVAIQDECNTMVYTNSSPVTPTTALDYHCSAVATVTLSGPSFQVYLNKGKEYLLTKVLTIGTAERETYLEHYLDTTNNTCIQDLADFETNEINDIDFTDCHMTCAACSTKVENYYLLHNNAAKADPGDPLYDPNYIYMSPYQKQKAIDKCMQPCKPLSLCQAQFEMMLQDMRTKGQYAEYDVDNAGACDASNYELSIFNEFNFLRISTIFGSASALAAGTPFKTYDITKSSYWRNPEHYNTGQHNFSSPTGVPSKDHYFDENGELSKVRLQQLPGGGYYPPVLSVLGGQIFTDAEGEWTYPENLADLKDFIAAYKSNPQWAYSLVKNHPEFNYFLDCDRQSDPAYANSGYTSEQFDADLREAETFDEANGTVPGINNPVTKWPSINQSGFENDPTLDLVSVDPYFNGNGAGVPNKSGFVARLTNFQGSLKSIKEIASDMFSAGNMYYSGCSSTFGVASNNCASISYPVTTEALDGMWRAYRELYLAEKQKYLLELAHGTACAPGGGQDNYFNGAIGDQNFSPWPAFSQFNFNPFFVSAIGNTQYTTLSQTIIDHKSLWPYYTKNSPGLPDKLLYHPPYGLGYFDFGSPSSYYMRGKYAAKIRRVPDLQTLSNSLANGATDIADIMANLQKNVENAIYLQTGQCPIFKHLEHFLATMAKKGKLAPGPDVPLYDEPSFTKELYDAIAGCGLLTLPGWYPLKLKTTLSGPNTLIVSFIDPGTTLPLPGADITLNNVSMTSISNWGDVRFFNGIRFSGSGGFSNFNIKVHHAPSGSPYAQLDFTGSTCIPYSCQAVAEGTKLEECVPTEQAIHLQNFLSAIVNDNITAAGTAINLSNFGNNQSSSYVTTLVNYPFSNGSASSATVIAPANNVIQVDGYTGSFAASIYFNFFPLGGGGPTDLTGALAFSDIQPNSTADKTYDFTIRAHYSPGSKLFKVKIGYPYVLCSDDPSLDCKRYELKSCSPYVPPQCAGNKAYKTKLQLQSLVNEVLMHNPGSPIPVEKLSRYNGLIKSQIGEGATECEYNIVNSTLVSPGIYMHHLSIVFSGPASYNPAIDITYCEIRFAFSSSWDQGMLLANKIDLAVTDMKAFSSNARDFSLEIAGPGESFYGSGSVSCLNLDNCETCTSGPSVYSEDFESYSAVSTTVNFGFITERHEPVNYPIPVPCNYAGFDPALTSAVLPPLTANWGDYYIFGPSNNITWLGTGLNLKNHTPSPGSQYFLMSEIWTQDGCPTPVDSRYVIPWMTKTPVATTVGLMYEFSIYYMADLEQKCETQLIVNDGNTDFVIASKVEYNYNEHHAPWWKKLSGTYYATTTSATLKVKVLPIVEEAYNCPGPPGGPGVPSFEMYRRFYLDDIEFRQKSCGNENITEAADTTAFTNDCSDHLMNIALTNAKQKYALYLEDIKKDFRKRYTEKCYEALEMLEVDFQSSEGHYTLYYYDQAGNLVKTVPPEGVEPINLSAFDPVTGLTYRAAISEDRKNKTHKVLTNHRLATRYEYNSLNQLIRQQLPDHSNNDLYSSTSLSMIPAAINVKSMDFSNSSRGYFVGDDGGSPAKSILYTTSDGGQSWNPASIFGSADIVDIGYCVNLNYPNGVAYAILSNGSMLYSSTYYQSTPAWATLPSMSSSAARFTDIEFVPGLVVGIITGKNGLVLISNDSGQNWSALNLGTSENLNKVHFMESSPGSGSWYGLIVGDNGTIYYTPTPNIFGNWQAYAGMNADIDFLNAAFINTGNGSSSFMDVILTGTDRNYTPPRGTVFQVTDLNGASPLINNLYTHGASSDPSKIEALAVNSYVNVGNVLDLVFAGAEASTPPTPILQKLQSTAPAAYSNIPLSGFSTLEDITDLVLDQPGTSSANIRGVSGDGQFFKLDAGSASVSPYSITLGSVTNTSRCNHLSVNPAVVNGGYTEGLIAAANGAIIGYDAATPGFTLQSDIGVPVLNALSAAKDGSGYVYAVGDGGKIIYSTDFGASWNVSGSGSNLYAVEYIPGPSPKVVVAGASGYIGQIDPSNNSLIGTVTAPGTRTYYSIATPLNNTLPSPPIFLAGGDGSSQAAIDMYSTGPCSNVFGGVPGLLTLHRIRFGPGGVAYAAGDVGTILNSTNGGASFNNVSTGGISFKDLVIKDATTVWLFGNGGGVKRTLNGAIQWTTLSGPSSNIQTLYYRGGGKMLGGGNGSTNLFSFYDESGDLASRFFYDALGRLIISQNAKQYAKAPKAYSYTTYDALGRITQVGEVAGSMTDPEALVSSNNHVIGMSDYTTWLGTGSKTEVTSTFYDEAVTTPCSFTQDNLRKRVAAIYLDEADDDLNNGYTHASYYSYDIHGNVKSLLQENPAMPVGHTCKKMDYLYDLISGKVNQVNYQPGQPDAFHHRYEYDADNRLTQVYTSKDGFDWSRDAKYFYYPHGPLARVELGNDKVQGLDYAYTLHGWIKGMNSVALDRNNDIGKDGLSGNDYNSGISDLHKYITNDIAGYALHYYSDLGVGGSMNDYEAIDAGKNTGTNRFDGDVSSYSHFDLPASLYNGNIMAMATGIYNGAPSAGAPVPQLATYHYDQLNRIKLMETTDQLTTNVWNPALVADKYRNEFSYDANGNIENQQKYDDSGTQIDDLYYQYLKNGGGQKLSNRLVHVNDAWVSAVNYDIDDQGTYGMVPNNYEYDQIGNLTKDIQEDINTIDWTVYGKIKAITRVGTSKPNLEFVYDAAGNRISKKAYVTGQPANEDIYTYYVRDAQGNVMATYDYKKDPLGGSMSPLLFSIREHPVYGSSRLGLRNYEDQDNVGSSSPYDTYASGGNSYAMALKSGNVSYELSNHLGNVLSVISDRKLPIEDVANPGTVDHYEADLLSSTDYYPFGQTMPGRQYNSGNYRYGFNGKENDNEVKGDGNQQDYGMRIYDPRLGRFLSVDPIAREYPFYSPYHFAGNRPIVSIDIDGLEPSPFGYMASYSGYSPDAKDQQGVAKDFIGDFKETMKDPKTYDRALINMGPFVVGSLVLIMTDGVGAGLIVEAEASAAASSFEEAAISRQLTRSSLAEEAVAISRSSSALRNSTASEIANGLNNRTLIIDENLSPTLATELKNQGFNTKIFEKGTSDADIINFAKENNGIVVTNNIKDFKKQGITTFEVSESLKPKSQIPHIVQKIGRVAEKAKVNPDVVAPGQNVKLIAE